MSLRVTGTYVWDVWDVRAGRVGRPCGTYVWDVWDVYTHMHTHAHTHTYMYTVDREPD